MVRGAVLEDGFVVINVSDEDHNHSSGSVTGVLATRTALAIIHRSHIELILVPVEGDGTTVESDHTSHLLNHELS